MSNQVLDVTNNEFLDVVKTAGNKITNFFVAEKIFAMESDLCDQMRKVVGFQLVIQDPSYIKILL